MFVLSPLLWAQVALALPYSERSGRRHHDHRPSRLRNHPGWHSEHRSTMPEESGLVPSRNHDYPTAYEAANGDVRISYSVTTAEYSITSPGTTLLSSSVITSYYTYTPVPRQLTSGTLSTSTTTVFVSPQPEPSLPHSSQTSSASVPDFTISIPESSLASLTVSEVQTVTAAPPTDTNGAVHTSLETSGNPTAAPVRSLSLGTSGGLSLVDTSTLSGIGPTATAEVTGISASNIFQPIETDAPPQQISARADHPVPTLGIQQQTQRLQTNKFYANFFLGDQTGATWTHPYSVSWSAGGGQTSSWGLAISHVERSQVSYGLKQAKDAGNSSYFANALGIQSVVLSAVELGSGTTLTTDTLEAFSVNVNLLAAGATSSLITFPLVQGMGFVTGCYNSGTPLLGSGIGISNLTYVGEVVEGTTFKYRANLTDDSTWLIYVTPANPAYQQNSFTLVSPVSIQGPSGFGGVIQVAKVSDDCPDAEQIYDGSAGVYATAADISGSVHGTTGTYSLTWNKQGAVNQPLLMFALPHHVQSFGSGSEGITDVQLQTTTKGMATGIQADSWTLVEPELPIEMAFDPWSPGRDLTSNLPLDVIETINGAATVELAQDIINQTNTGSMYYDGKALAKFAAIVYTAHQIANNATLAFTGLTELEAAFAVHVDNLQDFPLVYDEVWGGAVSISTYLSSNPGDDFGNTYYNDHHFHYGYFLYAAAVIGFLDPPWLTQGTNKQWVDMLARDYANSITTDSYFPFSRMFDWYMGHSWATGLFPSADGKNEESSSEDTMASYGIKMWGKITNDKNMEARGNLMLAVQARSLQNYFLYQDTNDVEPSNIIGNKVSGILFENKIDHTTFFGNNIEYIQGIHMLPLMPMSTLIRTPSFVQQEWSAYGFGTYAETLNSGWRGILMADLAIVDPVTSYDFFSNATGSFQYSMLDGGASQTWYLAWSAMLRGSTYGSKDKREGLSGEVRGDVVEVRQVSGPSPAQELDNARRW